MTSNETVTIGKDECDLRMIDMMRESFNVDGTYHNVMHRFIAKRITRTQRHTHNHSAESVAAVL